MTRFLASVPFLLKGFGKCLNCFVLWLVKDNLVNIEANETASDFKKTIKDKIMYSGHVHALELYSRAIVCQ